MTNPSINDQTVSANLTRGTYDRLVAELEDLTTRGRVEIAEQIESARALGDLSENGDYHAAKDFQGKMESRIRQLQALLKNVEVLDESEPRDGSVGTGSTVTLRYEGDDEDDTQQFFVGSIEERQGDLPVLSPSAPLGQVLLGKSAGDTVEYKAPGGILRVAIVAVDQCREDLGRPCRLRPRGRTRPALHRSPPDSRGHFPSGVRRAAPGRTDRPPT